MNLGSLRRAPLVWSSNKKLIGAVKYFTAAVDELSRGKVLDHDSVSPRPIKRPTELELRSALLSLRSASRRSSLFPSESPFKDLSPELDDWSVQTHLFPAASPRSSPDSILSNDGSLDCIYRRLISSFSSNDRIPSSLADRTAKRFVELSKCAERFQVQTESATTTHLNPPTLFIAVNHYFRKRRRSLIKDPLTLVLAHANGMHKETWEPALAELLLEPGSESRIEDIWSMDAVGQGDSGVINRDRLGGVQDWGDHAKDLIEFLSNYLPEASSGSEDLPEVLEPQSYLPNPSFSTRPKDGNRFNQSNAPIYGHPHLTQSVANVWRGRKVVLLGHSFSGCAAALAATRVPQLFHGVMLCDPAIFSDETEAESILSSYLPSSLRRRHVWLDRECARDDFLRKSFFKRWHPAVLNRYLHCAMIQDVYPPQTMKATVSLKCTKLQETAIFAEPFHRSKEATLELKKLSSLTSLNSATPPHVQLLWASQDTGVNPEHQLSQLMDQLKHIPSKRMEVGGHLYIQETPEAFAHQLQTFLKSL